MAAWKHYNYWTEAFYTKYRLYVRANAPKKQGSKLDCADLSVSLMIEFASENGLCLTFTDNAGVRYISKGTRQSPEAHFLHHNLKWGESKAEYVDAVLRRIGAKSLANCNMVINARGPEIGDLMLKSDHAALVCHVYPPGVRHPLAVRFVENDPPKNAAAIPLYPGEAEATRQVHQLTYYRDECPVGPLVNSTHFDYLNHRGSAKPNAELILYTDVKNRDLAEFKFYKYSAKVLYNWTEWDGNGDPR